ncbi:acyltransferase [Cyanobium sp. FGCU-6]|nr:acyltransferase [Cyanobium sp. FGCU6]
MSHINGSNASYRSEIDGLRALAVIAVIINHFNSRLLSSGYLGVDIFFVISGYVITESLTRRPCKNFVDFIQGFYARRFKRILPALIACVLITSLILCLFDPSPGVTLRTGLTSIFGASNIYLYSLSLSYFSPLNELNGFTHTWSLGVEEQFYLLYPFLFWIFVTRNLHSAKNVNRLLFAITVLSLASLLLFISFYETNPSAAYFLTPYRFWEIGLGCVISILGTLGSRQPQLLQRLRPILSLLFLGLIITVLNRPKEAEVLNTILIALLTMLAIGSLKKGQLAANILSVSPIRKIGLLSYSLYLWHWSVLVISRWTVGIHPWTAPFQLAAVLLLSLASYYWIEQPLRKANWSQTTLGDIRIGFISVALASAAQIGIGILPDRTLYTGDKSIKGLVNQPALSTPYRIQGTSNKGWMGEDCLLASNQDVGKKINRADCTLGSNVTSNRKILVLGNSVAAAMVPGLAKLTSGGRTDVIIVASYGSSPVAEIANKTPWAKANDYYWSKVVPDLLLQLHKGDIVLIVNELGLLLPHDINAPASATLAQLNTGLASLGRELKARGQSLAIINATPFIRESGCMPNVAQEQWFNGFGGPCLFHSKQYTTARMAPLTRGLARLERSQGVIVIDLMPLFCPQDRCTFQSLDGTMLYRDGNGHPSVEAALMAGDVILRKLRTTGVLR